MVATTVVHVDNVWLTSINRTGNSIDIQGESASINSVANFITQLKRSGYFDNVEIKTAQEDDIVPTIETYNFSMSAAIMPSGPTAAEAATGRQRFSRQPQAGTRREELMATSFRDWPWPLQALFYVGLAVALILVGLYVPGLPLSNVRTQLQNAQAEMKPIEADVQKLARLQAAPGGTAVRNGRAAKAIGDLADDRSGRQADRSVHPDGAERRAELGRDHPQVNGEARGQQALLLWRCRSISKRTVLITRCWISSHGSGGCRESSTSAI